MPFNNRLSIRRLRSDLALRALLEDNFKVAECSACGAEVSLIFVPSDDPVPCAECDRGVQKPLDRDFLRRCSAQVRQRVRRDLKVLLNLKSWWMAPRGKDAAPPIFPEPFAWLNRAWTKAGQPRGRPFDHPGKMAIASVLFALQSELGPSKPKSLPRHWPWKCDPKCTSLHLRVSLIVEWLITLREDPSVLRQRLKDHWARTGRDREDRERVQQKIVRVTALIKDLGSMIGYYEEPEHLRQELSELARWAVRQSVDPIARLEGEKIRPGRKHPRLNRERLPPCQWEWLPRRPDGTVDVTLLVAKGAKK